MLIHVQILLECKHELISKKPFYEIALCNNLKFCYKIVAKSVIDVNFEQITF